ncbi:glutathione S-transferase [Psychromonas sp. CNPT3]|uniref:glutathione S-transferase n=1 Tax=Psychromonas sp. CNPT3 TaxID=314282 RepID=UPI00006E539F|nr:glutathione S-transferase [Psychromonas sp. CNPT3]AGH81729.1 glutathione S-transferase [Psychromonas sp. CNPT3]
MAHTLYSFRRCPYAMRARLAISISQQQVHLREIVLKDKPNEMLLISPKGSVPVLQTASGEVLDESLDIMIWALEQHDPNKWLEGDLVGMLNLIDENDIDFKYWLDKYKYAVRFPEFPSEHYRDQGELFLNKLEQRLNAHTHLFDNHTRLADMAIFPFIRQWASVDKDYFKNSPYPRIKDWLNALISNPLFNSVMQKNPLWLSNNEEVLFP